MTSFFSICNGQKTKPISYIEIDNNETNLTIKTRFEGLKKNYKGYVLGIEFLDQNGKQVLSYMPKTIGDVMEKDIPENQFWEMENSLLLISEDKELHQQLHYTSENTYSNTTIIPYNLFNISNENQFTIILTIFKVSGFDEIEKPEFTFTYKKQINFPTLYSLLDQRIDITHFQHTLNTDIDDNHKLTIQYNLCTKLAMNLINKNGSGKRIKKEESFNVDVKILSKTAQTLYNNTLQYSPTKNNDTLVRIHQINLNDLPLKTGENKLKLIVKAYSFDPVIGILKKDSLFFTYEKPLSHLVTIAMKKLIVSENSEADGLKNARNKIPDVYWEIRKSNNAFVYRSNYHQNALNAYPDTITYRTSTMPSQLILHVKDDDVLWDDYITTKKFPLISNSYTTYKTPTLLITDINLHYSVKQYEPLNLHMNHNVTKEDGVSKLKTHFSFTSRFTNDSTLFKLIDFNHNELLLSHLEANKKHIITQPLHSLKNQTLGIVISKHDNTLSNIFEVGQKYNEHINDVKYTTTYSHDTIYTLNRNVVNGIYIHSKSTMATYYRKAKQKQIITVNDHSNPYYIKEKHKKSDGKIEKTFFIPYYQLSDKENDLCLELNTTLEGTSIGKWDTCLSIHPTLKSISFKVPPLKIRKKHIDNYFSFAICIGEEVVFTSDTLQAVHSKLIPFTIPTITAHPDDDIQFKINKLYKMSYKHSGYTKTLPLKKWISKKKKRIHSKHVRGKIIIQEE